MTEKRGKPGVAADGTTYVIDIPADHPDMDKLYLAVGMSAEKIRTYNPNLTEEEVVRYARECAEAVEEWEQWKRDHPDDPRATYRFNPADD